MMKQAMQAQRSSSRVVLRNVVILALLAIFSYYFYTYLDKLLKGQVGISVTRQPKTQFDFPSISFCGHVSSHSTEKPWVLYAEANLQVEGEEDATRCVKVKETPSCLHVPV